MLRIVQILSASLVVLNLTGCGTTRCIVQRLDNLGKRCFCLQDSLCCDSGCQPGCPHSSGQAVVQPMAMQPTFAQPMMQQLMMQPMAQQPMMQQQPMVHQQPMMQQQPMVQQNSMNANMNMQPNPAQNSFQSQQSALKSVLTEPVLQVTKPDEELKEELDELKDEHDSTKTELDSARDAIDGFKKELTSTKSALDEKTAEISTLRNQQLENKLERSRIDARYRQMLEEQELAIQQFESRLQQMVQQMGNTNRQQPLNADSNSGGSYRPQQRFR